MGRTKGAKNKGRDIYNQVIDIETNVVENFQQNPNEIISIIEKKERKNNDSDEDVDNKILHCSENQRYSYKKFSSGCGFIYQYICLTI